MSRNYQCITCESVFVDGHKKKYFCVECGEEYEIGKNYLKTFFDKKLFNIYCKDYLLNKVLNNNGYISYQFLKESSISLPDREDVKRFRSFVQKNHYGSVILDIGCGPMDIPGYLMLDNINDLDIIGLDPIDSNNFNGLRIVGCSEFIPLPKRSVDTIIFATSLDHVCNLKKTISESLRLLTESGKILVWMSDRTLSPLSRIKYWISEKFRSLKAGYPLDKYYLYDNWTVLGTPPGAVDPFHCDYESPKKIIKMFCKEGMSLLIDKRYSKNEVFLSFKKKLS